MKIIKHAMTINFSELLLSAIFTLSLPSFVIAQEDHQPLTKSTELSFSEIFNSTLLNTPEYQELSIRQTQADAYSENGKSLIANRASLQLNYVDDGLMDDTGLREIEYGIQVPLWRLGERKSSQQLGQNYQVQVNSWTQNLHLTIAGKLRSVLAILAEAENALTIEEQVSNDANRILNISESLFSAGEISQLDVMYAKAQLLEQSRNTLKAEANLVDAEREYKTLTGLDVRPNAFYPETLSEQTEISPNHPKLILLQANIDLAETSIKQAEQAAKGSPTLSLGSRRERPDRFQPSVDSITLGLNIPIGGQSFVSAKTSSVRRNKVTAEVLYLNTYRQLTKALHEVEHELHLTKETIELSDTQTQLSEQRAQMALSAFEVGEVTLIQVIQAIQDSRLAKRDFQKLMFDQQRLTSEFNQLIGVLP